MADQISMPAGFGGLMRFNEEYESKIMLKPTHVVVFVILILILVYVIYKKRNKKRKSFPKNTSM